MIFSSENNQYQFSLNDQCLRKILMHIKKAGQQETGGILIGTYNADHSTAILRKVTGPPSDSKHGFTWFERGLKGLQNLLDSLWGKGQYYLGEWHFHPQASPNPSFQDISQMKSISDLAAYHCPEPVLLIIGGNHDDHDVRVFIYLRKDRLIELKEKAGRFEK